jgi:hypothetical protein
MDRASVEALLCHRRSQLCLRQPRVDGPIAPTALRLLPQDPIASVCSRALRASGLAAETRLAVRSQMAAAKGRLPAIGDGCRRHYLPQRLARCRRADAPSFDKPSGHMTACRERHEGAPAVRQGDSSQDHHFDWGGELKWVGLNALTAACVSCSLPAGHTVKPPTD